MERPASPEGIRCFLRHVTYMSKFVPNLSAESEPLGFMVIKKDFVWKDTHQETFFKLKEMLSKVETLQYFDVKSSAVIQTVASTASVRAVLLQHKKPVTYASRSLTTSETHYALIDLDLVCNHQD